MGSGERRRKWGLSSGMASPLMPPEACLLPSPHLHPLLGSRAQAWKRPSSLSAAE